ncbi:TRAP transporter large permease subunit [Shinella pollutisoli]|uniref:TRAP transporter large permease subunit n=1 Tax=Shinella pollutisoli TaxID=2250594 RepID=A0ABV7DFM7_9HYPH|nr:TRAP transporter large permease subunit [Shinella pollutisoli]
MSAVFAASPGRALRLAATIEAALGTVCGGLLAALLALVLATVLLRYGFSAGFAGAEELGIWLHVALVFLGAPLSLAGALAMRFDGIVQRLPRGGERAAAVVADALTVAAALVLALGGGRVVGMLGGVSPALGLPEGLRFVAPALGGGLMLAVLALRRIGEGRGAGLSLSLAAGLLLYAASNALALPAGLPPSAALGLFALLGLAAGAPLPHAFLAAAQLAVPFGSPLPGEAIVSATVGGLSKFLLTAIPFFLLAGGLLTVSGAAARIVCLAASLVGHRRAGLAQTALLTSVLFSGASGSSVANAAFGAATFQPELVRNGYPPARAGAVVAAASVLDNVIPPSIAFLILAVATELPVGPLLAWGFAAGGVMALCLAAAIHLTAGDETALPRAEAAERRRAAGRALPALGLGAVVVLGIRLGIVTTTEAAALAALYTLLLCLAAKSGGMPVAAAFRQAGAEAAAIGLLIGSAAPFAFLLAVDGVAGLVSSFAGGLGLGAAGVLLAVNLMLLAVGLVLDIGAAILLFAPIVLPLAVAAGIDPVHFGVVLVVNLMIGGLTPPVGILVLVVSGVTRVPAAALFAAVLPFLAALLVALALLSAGALLL